MQLRHQVSRRIQDVQLWIHVRAVFGIKHYDVAHWRFGHRVSCACLQYDFDFINIVWVCISAFGDASEIKLESEGEIPVHGQSLKDNDIVILYSSCTSPTY